jgi:hypothetical protein
VIAERKLGLHSVACFVKAKVPLRTNGNRDKQSSSKQIFIEPYSECSHKTHEDSESNTIFLSSGNSVERIMNEMASGISVRENNSGDDDGHDCEGRSNLGHGTDSQKTFLRSDDSRRTGLLFTP